MLYLPYAALAQEANALLPLPICMEIYKPGYWVALPLCTKPQIL